MHRHLAALLLLSSAPGAPVTLRLDPARASEWTVASQLFGSYQEEHWGDITPGVYEQCLVNPTFAPWHRGPKENKTRLVFPVGEQTGLAYPWEPHGEAGRVEWSFADGYEGNGRAQRTAVADETGGVAQRLALPDYRVRRYRLRVHVRTTGTVRVKAQLLAGTRGDEVRDEHVLDAGDAWRTAEVELDLRRPLPERHLGRYGVARLLLAVEGNGTAAFAQATLFPVDAVDGIWNPETLAHLARVRPTAVRWPGGNFASAYRWRDGIGPVDRRPSRPNRVWGGVEPNHVGTDEWLRFCEKTGMEPVMGVGFGEVTAEEAADWVEYCNGDAAATRLGALRAAHGRTKPYGVKVWGVGNEVYGDYQIGHTDAATYARGLAATARAMKSRDPSIRIAAVGLGAHNEYRGQHRDWTSTVLELAGPEIDLLDVHHYVYGPNARELERFAAEDVKRALLGAGQRIEAYYEKLRAQVAARPETRHVRLAHYEWAVLPRAESLGFARQTWWNALATAGQYHAFLRHGDFVRGAMLHNFSVYVQPVAGHAEPPNPRTEVSRLFREVAGNARLVPVTIDGPRYDVPANIPEIGPLHGVQEIDAVALLDSRGRLHVSVLNRSGTTTHAVRIAGAAAHSTSAATWRRLDSAQPAAPVRWERSPTGAGARETRGETGIVDGEVRLDVPPASLTLVEFPRP